MHPKAKKLIINADDYGLCDSVSQGILDCYKKGIVSDFSFIINPDTFSESVALMRQNHIIRCGIHFNLTLGSSYFKPVVNITDEKGNYFSVKQHFINTLRGALNESDVHSEFKRQLQLLRNNKIEITHFDTHQNVHILPPVYRAIRRLSLENGNIPIRVPKENISITYRYKLTNLKRILIFNYFSLFIKNLSKNGTPVQAIGGDFYNNQNPGKVVEYVIRHISSSKHSVFELAVHPGYFSDEILKYDPYAHQRETELRLLIDKKNFPESAAIQISSFADL